MSAFALLLGVPSVTPNLSWAVDPPPAPISMLRDRTAGRELYQTRCASCHDNPTDRIPSKDALIARGPDEIVRALVQGPMQPMASGLSRADIDGLVIALTGRAPLPVLAAEPDPNPCSKSDPIHITSDSWNGWGVDDANTRFQPSPGLSARDVPNLKVKWTFAYPGSKNSQVTVIGDRLFFGSNAGKMYSLNAKTGCVYWRYDAKGGMRTAPVVAALATSPSGYAVLIGDDRAVVTALDAKTGKELWARKIETHPRSMITGAPKIHDGVAYVPLSSSEEITTFEPDYVCCTFRGSVVALSMKDGAQLWKTYTTPDEPKRFKNALGHELIGPAGGAIWSSPTIDAKRGVLYVATGDSYTDVDHVGSDAIIAMELKTGKVKWINQVTAKDNFIVGCPRTGKIPENCPTPTGPDVDFGSSVILRPLLDKSGGKDILIAGQKSAVVYGIDPETGKTLWQNKAGRGGAAGGVEWGMAADSNNVYVAIADSGTGGQPGLNALTLATGETNWHTATPVVPCKAQRCPVAQSAPASAIPGIVFSGAVDGHLRGYDANSGNIVWDFDTAAEAYDTVNGVKGARGGALDATGPVITKGMLFQHSGYPGVMMLAGGQNLLIAFSVNGK
jgi:polyvinyl alcohol dehydrogenase (cytochrome)